MRIPRTVRGGRRKGPRERKDRLIQTRVAGPLDDALKQEAAKRRLSVSHLIRNVLEDSFHLVDAVVAEVDTIVQDSVELAQQVRREAKTVSDQARQAVHEASEVRNQDPSQAEAPSQTTTTAAETPASEHRDGPHQHSTQEAPPEINRADTNRADNAEEPEDPFADVYAWNPVVINRPGPCASCDTHLAKGASGHLGMTMDAQRPPRFLCDQCIDHL